MKIELRLDKYCMALLGYISGTEDEKLFLNKVKTDPHFNVMFELIKKLVFETMLLGWKDEI